MSESQSEILTYQKNGKLHFTSCPYSLQPALKIGSTACKECEYYEGEVIGHPCNAIYCSYTDSSDESEAR